MDVQRIIIQQFQNLISGLRESEKSKHLKGPGALRLSRLMITLSSAHLDYQLKPIAEFKKRANRSSNDFILTPESPTQKVTCTH